MTTYQNELQTWKNRIQETESMLSQLKRSLFSMFEHTFEGQESLDGSGLDRWLNLASGAYYLLEWKHEQWTQKAQSWLLQSFQHPPFDSDFEDLLIRLMVAIDDLDDILESWVTQFHEDEWMTQVFLEIENLQEKLENHLQSYGSLLSSYSSEPRDSDSTH